MSDIEEIWIEIILKKFKKFSLLIFVSVIGIIGGFNSSIEFKGSAAFFGATRSAEVWGPNLNEFKRRFHPSSEPQALSRLRNLFVIYSVELRAMAKVAPLLRQYSYYTGNTETDKRTHNMVMDILDFIEWVLNLFKCRYF